MVVLDHAARLTTDPLPVIVIMVTMTWVGSYIAAWAILRWRNAILGLVPGAAALIWDASFSNGKFSITATMYLVLGVLLFMRLRVQRDQARWEREDVPYPQFIALSVIHATFWATLFLLAASWVVPLGAQSTSANARWSALTARSRVTWDRWRAHSWRSIRRRARKSTAFEIN